MIQKITKDPKVALCRKCHGTGRIYDSRTKDRYECDQCEGSGRVTVSAEMTLDIRPYNPTPKYKQYNPA